MYRNIGFLIDDEGNKRKVKCNEKSIYQNEFYSAMQSDLKVEKKIIMQRSSYRNELKFEFRGTIYSILRTYTDINTREIELILTQKLGDLNG